MRSAVLFIVTLATVFPLCAQDWTRELKPRSKRDALHDRTQHVRGDSGKWNDNAFYQIECYAEVINTTQYKIHIRAEILIDIGHNDGMWCNGEANYLLVRK